MGWQPGENNIKVAPKFAECFSVLIVNKTYILNKRNSYVNVSGQ